MKDNEKKIVITNGKKAMDKTKDWQEEENKAIADDHDVIHRERQNDEVTERKRSSN